MIKNLNELRQDFKEVLELNNIRGYALSLEFGNLGRTVKTQAQFSQSDVNTSVITVQLLNNGLPIIIESSSILYVGVKRADGTPCRNKCTVINGEIGAISIQFNQSSVGIVGKNEFEITVRHLNNSKLISPKVSYQVFESIDSLFEEPSQDGIDIIDIVLDEVVQIKDEVLKTNETINAEMLERDIVEANREKAESARQSNEAIRNVSEDNRIESETIRIEKEVARLKDETIRLQNEEGRKTNESARQSSETIRRNEESKRVNTESKRVESETTRTSNENIRVTKESERTAKEITRTESEKARIESEKTRLGNETIRHNSESVRTTNEVTRNSNESKRITDENVRTAKEVERVEAEIVREDSEAFRVAAEIEREKKIVEFGSQLKIIKTEVDEANTDFNKIPHNNLQERLTTDFGDIHDRLNKAEIMEFDGSDINAKTFAGYTKEMEIRGKTWQNLINKQTSSESIYQLGYGVKDNLLDVVLKKEFSDEIAKFSLGNVVSDFSYCYILINKDNIPHKLKVNTEYTLMVKIKSNKKITDSYLQVIEGNSTNALHVSGGAFNIEVGTHYMKLKVKTKPSFDGIYIGKQGLYMPLNIKKEVLNGLDMEISEATFLEGDYTNKPIPEEYFEGIMSTGEAEMVNGKYKVGVESSGKNLIDVSSKEYTVVRVNESYNQLNKCIFQNIKLDPKKLYKFSFKSNNPKFNVGHMKIFIHHTKIGIELKTHDHAWANIQITGVGKEYRSSAIIENAEYLTCTTGGSFAKEVANIGDTIVLTDFQLEEVQTIDNPTTTYEPHQKDSTSYLLDEPLRSLPNGVQDTISKDGILSRRIGKVVLDDALDWLVWQSNSVQNRKVTCFAFRLVTSPQDRDFYCLSDKFATGSANASLDHPYYTPNLEVIYGLKANQYTNQFVGISILQSKLETNDVSGFKKWLQANPTTVYYELAEPIITNLKKKPTLKVYEGVTYIKSTNSIKADLAVKLPCNVNLMLSDSLKENKLLKDNIQALEVENKEMRAVGVSQEGRLLELEDVTNFLVSDMLRNKN